MYYNVQMLPNHIQLIKNVKDLKMNVLLMEVDVFLEQLVQMHISKKLVLLIHLIINVHGLIIDV